MFSKTRCINVIPIHIVNALITAISVILILNLLSLLAPTMPITINSLRLFLIRYQYNIPVLTAIVIPTITDIKIIVLIDTSVSPSRILKSGTYTLLVSTPDQKKLIFLYPQISLPIIPAIAVY